MERSTQKNGLVNLAVALVIFLAGFGVTVFAGSLAGQVAAIFLGLGVLVTFISWFQMRLEENERAEKLELDELARSLSVSVPFIRLEVKRGRLKAAHLGRRVVVLDTEVRRYLAQASESGRSWR